MNFPDLDFSEFVSDTAYDDQILSSFFDDAMENKNEQDRTLPSSLFNDAVQHNEDWTLFGGFFDHDMHAAFEAKRAAMVTKQSTLQPNLGITLTESAQVLTSEEDLFFPTLEPDESEPLTIDPSYITIMNNPISPIADVQTPTSRHSRHDSGIDIVDLSSKSCSRASTPVSVVNDNDAVHAEEEDHDNASVDYNADEDAEEVDQDSVSVDYSIASDSDSDDEEETSSVYGEETWTYRPGSGKTVLLTTEAASPSPSPSPPPSRPSCRKTTSTSTARKTTTAAVASARKTPTSSNTGSARKTPASSNTSTARKTPSSTSARKITTSTTARKAPSSSSKSNTPISSHSTARKTGWSPDESSAAIHLMKLVCSNARFAGTEKRFGEVSRRLGTEYGVSRTQAAVKLAWNRYLRLESGFEDRGHKKRSSSLVTSALGGGCGVSAGSKRKRNVVEIKDESDEESETEDEDEEMVWKPKRKLRKVIGVIDVEEVGGKHDEDVEEEEPVNIEDDEALARRLQAEENGGLRRRGRA